jgi:hypothetical protein
MMKRFRVPVVFFALLLVTACKNDDPVPRGAKDFTLLDLELDDRPYSAKYSNSSAKPEIVLSFSQPVDRGSAKSHLLLTGSSGSVQLEFSFQNADSMVVIKPVADLKFLTNYEFYLLPELTSASKKKFNSTQIVKIITAFDPGDKFPLISDNALLDSVQRKTFKYFWDFAHPSSGMARERNTSGNTVTTGGSGFGIMSIIVGMERNFITRLQGLERLDKMLDFLETADRFHGVWPHWIDGNTGKVIPFSANDNGGDLVETSFLVQGLLTFRQYLNPADVAEQTLVNRINTLWNTVEWDWYTQNGQDVLYWHWSPDKAWIMNHQINQ